MSLFDISQFPEKESSTVLRCKICNGIMHEQAQSLYKKIMGTFLSIHKNTKTYRCEECNKELYIRER